MKRILVFLIIAWFSLSFVIGKPRMRLNLATINIRVSTKKDSANSWNYRKEKMADFIKTEGLDIVCLQEVSAGQLDFLRSSLPEYGCTGDEYKIVKGEEYLPILYKKDQYDCMESGTFCLSETPGNVGETAWDAANPRRASWAKLKERKGSRFFYVVNTHLDHKGKLARERGMALIKSYLKAMAADNPIVLCGDMNCTSTSQPHYIALNESFIMYDAYQIAGERVGVNYTYHAFGKKLPVESRSMIDFIFVSKQIEVERVDIPEEKNEGGAYLSDHCPVITTLKM